MAARSGREPVDERYLGLTYRGQPLGTAVDDFAPLRRSDDVVDDGPALRTRMEEDGYLYLPGLLRVDEVRAARLEVLERLSRMGALDPSRPVEEGAASAEARPDPMTGPFMPRLARDNPPLEKVLYDGPMMAFYERFLGGPVRHFDYTWYRCKRPGITQATTPHLDIVYMGRGTRRLYTSWVPFGDVPLEMGGLILLEASHRNRGLREGYGATDVDLYCRNEGGAEAIVEAARLEGRDLTGEERAAVRWNSTGMYCEDARDARAELGGRWLTGDYRMGDVLVFCMYLLHASTDNRTDRLRLSTDSRYQLASEPVDERWVGTDPPAHGIRAKRGMVC